MKKLLTALLALALLCVAPAALALDVPTTESEIPALPAAFTEAAEKYEVPIADLFKSLEPGEDMQYRVVLSGKPELPKDATVEVYLEVLAQGGAYRPASDSVTDNGWELVYQTNSAFAPDELGVFIRYTFPSVAADGKTLQATDQYTCDHTGALRTHELFLSDLAVSPAYVMDYYYDADNRLSAYEEGTSEDLYRAFYKDGALRYFIRARDMYNQPVLQQTFAPDGLPFDRNEAGRKVVPVTDDAGNEIGKLIVHFDDRRVIDPFPYFARNDEPEVFYESRQNGWTKYDLAKGVQTEGVTPAGAPDSQFISAIKAPLVLGTLPADAAEASPPAELQSVIDEYAFPEDIVKSVENLGNNQYRVHFSQMIQDPIEESTGNSYMSVSVGYPTLYLDGQKNWAYGNSNGFVEEEGGCYFDIPVEVSLINSIRYENSHSSEEEIEVTVDLPLWYTYESRKSLIQATIDDVFSADGKRIRRSVTSGDARYQDTDGKLALTSYSDGNLTGSYNPETGKLESVRLNAEFWTKEEYNKGEETWEGRLRLTRSADGMDALFESNAPDGYYMFLLWDSEQKTWMTEDGEPYAGEFPEDLPANPEEIDLGVTF